MHRTEHAATTALVCMDRLTRLMAGGGEKTAASDEIPTDASQRFSMRYGVKEGMYCFHMVEFTDDPLSLMVLKSNGVIYEAYDNGPRLLCEELVGGVDKTELMKNAIKFFFPNLCNIIQAFWVDPSSEYCFQAIDDCGLIALIIFGFEDFGKPEHINLLLHGKFQLRTDLFSDIHKHMLCKRGCTPDEFAQSTAEYVQECSKGVVEQALTEVLSHSGVGAKPFEIKRGNISWPQTELTRLILSMGWSVYDYKTEYYGGVVVCADMIIRDITYTQKLIPVAICEIHTNIVDVRLAYNTNNTTEPFTCLCWRAITTDRLVFMFCFHLEMSITRGGLQTYKLIMRKINMSGMNFDMLLGKLKASANWSRVTDSSKFSNDILFEARKEQMRLRRLSKPPPTPAVSAVKPPPNPAV